MSKPNALTVVDWDKKYPLTHFNRIMPSTRQIASVKPYHTVSVEILTISPKVEDREVFKLANTKVDGKWVPVFSLTKLALDRIGNVLGVEWIPEQCHRTDDRQDPNIVEFTAGGRVPKVDGLDFTSITGTKQIDVNAYVDEHRYKCEEKVLSRDGWTFGGETYKALDDPKCQEALVRSAKKRSIEVNKHKLALAESGAKNRAIRGYGLLTTYTEEQLKKPFAVQHLHMDSEAIDKDPKAKAAVLKQALGAKDNLFPSETIQDAYFQETPANTGASPVEEETNEPDATTKRAVQEQEFKTFDADDRFDALKRMVSGTKLKIGNRETFLKMDDITQVKNLMWVYDEIHIEDEDNDSDLPY